MKATVDVINTDFTPVKVGSQTYYSFKFGDQNQYELAVEPTLINGILEVALYENRTGIMELMTENKLPVKAVMRGVDNVTNN